MCLKGAVFTVFCLISSLASSQIVLNYAAGWGEFDVDQNNDGISEEPLYEETGFAATGVTVSGLMDRFNKTSGGASQRMVFTRNTAGSSGVYQVRGRPIKSYSPDWPEVGDTMTISFDLKVDLMIGGQFKVVIDYINGATPDEVLLTASAPTNGFQHYEFQRTVPNAFRGFYLELDFEAGTDVVNCAYNIDNLRITTGKTLRPPRPSSLKFARIFSIDENFNDPITSATNNQLAIIPDPEGVAQLKAIKPDMPVFMIDRGFIAYTYEGQPNDVLGRNGDLFPYTYADAFHPEWFLLDSQGNRIAALDDPGFHGAIGYLMDYGNEALQDHVFSSLLDLHGRAFSDNPDLIPAGMMLDSSSIGIRQRSTTYPTRESGEVATTKWFTRYNNLVRSKIPIIANMGSNDLSAWPHSYWLTIIDGYLREQFTNVHGDGRLATAAKIEDHVHAILSNPDKIAVIVNPYYPDNRQYNLHGIAGFYIVNHENTYMTMSAVSDIAAYTEQPFPEELFLPLGTPVSNTVEQYDHLDRKKRGSLFVRRYTNGVALLNTSDTATYKFVPDHNYVDHDGVQHPAGVLMNIPPRTGWLLYRP